MSDTDDHPPATAASLRPPGTAAGLSSRPRTANIRPTTAVNENTASNFNNFPTAIPEDDDDDEGMFSFLPPAPQSAHVVPQTPSYPQPTQASFSGQAHPASRQQLPTRATQPPSARPETESSVLLSPAAAYASMMSRRRNSKQSDEIPDGMFDNTDPYGTAPPTAASEGYTVSQARSPKHRHVFELDQRMAHAQLHSAGPGDLSRADSSEFYGAEKHPALLRTSSIKRNPVDYTLDGSLVEPLPHSPDLRSASTLSGYADKYKDLETFDGTDPNDLMADLQFEEEEDSPFPEVRASVSNVDDPEMPCLTFRSWVLGIGLTSLVACLNFFFSLRYPSTFLSSICVQIVAYPCGKFLAYILPTRYFATPEWCQRWFGWDSEWSFNPGPFNIKEHTVIVLMANTATVPAYALNVTLALTKEYGVDKGPGFDIVLVLSSQMIGFAFAGMCRRFLVWPAGLVWPSNLVICTLLNTFHAEDDDGRDGSMTRFRFFALVAGLAGAYFVLPSFLFTALSTFSYICWMAPDNVIVNQLFGVSTGLGMGILTFDWSQISYIGSPLIQPWWSIANIFAGFVIVYWIITPAMYYSNALYLAYMPMWSTEVFDRFGNVYDTSIVLDAQNRLNETAYLEYSPLYLPATYLTVYSLAFALSTAAIVHTALYHGPSIIRKLKNVKSEPEDIHMKLMRNYPEVPDWWYACYFAVFFGLSIVAIEVYDTGMPVWALLIGIALAFVYILPGGFIFAMTTQQITVNLLAELIPGYLLPGAPIAVMTFKAFSVWALQSGFNFTQDLKLGHYMKIAPRITFTVQVVCTAFACLTQIAVKYWLQHTVKDFCEPDQKDFLVCPTVSVFYSASVIWGIIGPQRLFNRGSPYHPILWSALIGCVLPLPFWFLAKRWPKSWFRYINVPVLLVGATYIPPATGINYSSWFVVGFIFQYWFRRYRFRWWSKFIFVLSAALEGGTVISGILIFVCLQLPKGGLSVNWWGNNVYVNTADYNDVSLRTPPPEGFGPSTWQA